ncbi:sugar phosphate isomerase/epimerase family protein [Acuticoccus sp. MNP-M23]|uniref:sugar phosphate isomerase/epimerase family protein n=1 Tax=Acuticoccus sp. MNP-M23 TaxID=3072793 RepID=UPI002814C1F0|nr:sugar phosphate isomerase/epimerase family protein [Acuticoccus sp. MNP-M23]WMS42122.1 sugar phosphate isomerase/epimerase family protein [Acuticoccus sp. MNP-M23]
MSAALPTLGVALTTAELAQHLALVRDAGRDVEIQDFRKPAILAGDWSPVANEVKRLLSGHEGRWGIHGPYEGFSLSASDPDVRAIIHKRFDRALDACEAIGASHMVVHSPVSVWDYHNLDDWPDARERLVQAFHDNVAPAVKRAADIGCPLVVENIQDCEPAMRVEMVKAFDSPGIRVSLDTGHANYCHGRHNAPPVDYYVRAAGKLLAHVHLQDTDGYADRHWIPGDGHLRWKHIFRVLHETSQLDHGNALERPRLIIEIRNKALLPDAVAYLTELGVAR